MHMHLLFWLSVVPFVTRWMGEPLHVGDDWKGTASPLLYVIGIVAASFAPYAAGVIYALAAGLWLVPDKRIERVLMD